MVVVPWAHSIDETHSGASGYAVVMWRWALLCASLLACGDDDTPMDVDAGASCTTDDECDDGVFCNGVETCAGRCVAGDSPCVAGQTCDEDAATCVTECSVDADADDDGVMARECGGTDCDDSDPERFPGAVEICDGDDEDCDDTTFGDDDADGDGYVDAACCNGDTCGTDCDDSDSGAHPDLAEVCNGADTDCDGMVDEGVQVSLWPDADGDDFGDASATETMGCPGTEGFSDVGTDCDDSDRSVNPGAPEVCDAFQDNSCDEGSSPFDRDLDGFDDLTCGGLDCDDTMTIVRPDIAVDECDGVDADCDGLGEDFDGDNRLPEGATCEGGPAGELPRDDCNDRYRLAFPGALELCDGVDTDCDGAVDEEGFLEDDTTGFGEVDLDCWLATRPAEVDPLTDQEEFRMQVNDIDDVGVPGLEIEVHRDDVIEDTCEAPRCTVVTTDSLGRANVMLRPNTWFAYRIRPMGLFLENLVTHEVVPETPAASIGIGAQTTAQVAMARESVPIPAVPDTGIVQVRVQDCGGESLRNVLVRVYEGDAPVCGFYAYLDSDSRDFSGTMTDESGQAFVLNVPATGTTRYVVEAWSLFRAPGEGTATYHAMGREEVFVRPDALSTTRIGPLRANGPDR